MENAAQHSVQHEATSLATMSVIPKSLSTLLTSATSTRTGIIATGVVLYLIACSSLRFRYEKAMLRRFNYPDRASLARMTNDDAQSILQYIMTYEFPFLYKLALQFAIFKTYGFPTMSKLITSTKSFSDTETAPKRYEDTTVIFAEFSLNPPTSDRCLKAIARMNHLHSFYKKGGKISNDDFLYTLAVCVMEPIRFMKLYEWRQFNAMERCAIGVFWKSIGDAMEIDYAVLGRDNNNWESGLDFVDDITRWAKEYEVRAMIPHDMNRGPADALVSLMFFYVPKIFKPFALKVMTVVMGDRVREAFRYPEPGIFAALLAFAALNIRRLVLRFFTLPRLSPVQFFEVDRNTGRIYHNDYLVEPWYHKPTLWSRWGPMGIFIRLYGGTVPGGKGADGGHMAEGFFVEDLGPKSRVGEGLEEVEQEVGRLRQARTSGCPFSVTTSTVGKTV